MFWFFLKVNSSILSKTPNLPISGVDGIDDHKTIIGKLFPAISIVTGKYHPSVAELQAQKNLVLIDTFFAIISFTKIVTCSWLPLSTLFHRSANSASALLLKSIPNDSPILRGKVVKSAPESTKQFTGCLSFSDIKVADIKGAGLPPPVIL